MIMRKKKKRKDQENRAEEIRRDVSLMQLILGWTLGTIKRIFMKK